MGRWVPYWAGKVPDVINIQTCPCFWSSIKIESEGTYVDWWHQGRYQPSKALVNWSLPIMRKVCMYILWCICMGLGHNDTWVAPHVTSTEVGSKRDDHKIRHDSWFKNRLVKEILSILSILPQVLFKLHKFCLTNTLAMNSLGMKVIHNDFSKLQF